MTMLALFKNLLFWTLGATLMLAVLEGTLRLLPVSMGLNRNDNTTTWPLRSYEPGLPYAYSNTWAMLNAQRGKTNNYGQISPFDFTQGSRPIVVIGDSYVESLMNPHADTLQGQLGQKLGRAGGVYGLGVSGLSASDYLVLAGQARQEFTPAAAIFVITDGDFSESLSERPGNYWLKISSGSAELQYTPLSGESTIKKIRKKIGDSALYRYFQVNLKFSPPNPTTFEFWKKKDARSTSRAVQNVEWQRIVVDWFLTNLTKSLALPNQCTVFLVDSDRYALYDPRRASSPKDSPEIRKYFIDQAKILRFKVVDLGESFARAYREAPMKFDHWPIDRHWNRRGHGIAADEAYRLIVSEPACGLPAFSPAQHN